MIGSAESVSDLLEASKSMGEIKTDLYQIYQRRNADAQITAAIVSELSHMEVALKGVLMHAANMRGKPSSNLNATCERMRRSIQRCIPYNKIVIEVAQTQALEAKLKELQLLYDELVLDLKVLQSDKAPEDAALPSDLMVAVRRLEGIETELNLMVLREGKKDEKSRSSIPIMLIGARTDSMVALANFERDVKKEIPSLFPRVCGWVISSSESYINALNIFISMSQDPEVKAKLRELVEASEEVNQLVEERSTQYRGVRRPGRERNSEDSGGNLNTTKPALE